VLIWMVKFQEAMEPEGLRILIKFIRLINSLTRDHPVCSATKSTTYATMFLWNAAFIYICIDRLCGLVVRVPGC
jgi:hypothetical protein